MADGKKLIRIVYLLFLIFLLNNINLVMAEKPYHHLQDGTFRNPEGSPKRDPNIRWSYKIFNKEKKKLDMTVPKNHVIDKHIVKKKFRKI